MMCGFNPIRFAGKTSKWLKNTITGSSIINYRNKGVINFIDIGSMGRLPEPWFSNARYIKTLLSFEPLGKPVKRRNTIISPDALWSENRKKPFYIYKGLKSTGSSLYEQNFEYVDLHFDTLKSTGPRHLADTWHDRSELLRVTETDCKTLDFVLKEMDLPFSFDFLKIDAQGAEYEILRGAENFLESSCTGLHLELFNIPLYKGIKLMPEVVDYLSGFGFGLIKKLPAHGTFNSQNDCIFIKKDIPTGREEIKKLILKIYSINSSV